MRTLYVAAGGGGDAVGALLARRALGDTDERPPLVTTCAWERLRIDPVPGPRARADFTGLGLVRGEPVEVLPDSDTVPAGRSVLPRLAETSGARIFLHDFEGGAVGLTAQLQRLATSLDVDGLVVLDVGGDVVARGMEPDLRSPLADSLTLAAALKTGVPTSVAVLGPGADAELSEGDVLGHLKGIGAAPIGRVTLDDVRSLCAVLAWHPTEATALVAAAARGTSGAVAMRRGHAPVRLTARTPEVWVTHDPAPASFPLAQVLMGSTSLSDAEGVMRRAAVNEIDFEREVAAETPADRSRAALNDIILDMQSVGATHITNRRLSETLHHRIFRLVISTGESIDGLWSRDELSAMADRMGRGTSNSAS